MRIQVPMIGDGSEGNEYRAELPIYTMVAANYDAMVAIVDIPDKYLPTEVLTSALLVKVPGVPGDTAILLPSAVESAWQRKLDRDYPDRVGKYAAKVGIRKS